ncbi:hypothetical protein FRC03_004762 [Tulasnella sp. 419]|nr:hypothetical protein FRC03_004762 [Tulasnella sp. 419]
MKPFGHVTQDTLKLKKEEDIFALGVIGWELFSGREAYSDLDSDEFYDWVVKEGKGLDLEEISNLEAREFISRCFEETEEELALPPVEE